MTLIDAMEDPALFGRWFKGKETWGAWVVVIKALFALQMDAAELETWGKLTGRSYPPEEAAREAHLVMGRRSGKSRVAALIAVFLACFVDYSRFLAPGERGVVMILAADRQQARVIMRYVVAMLNGVPMLAALIQSETKESVELTNGIVIEIHTASYRTTRGYTCVAALCDEIAFWRSEESANPDTEIIDALRPATATIPNALLLCMSSPYARAGVLWQAYSDHFGRDGDPVLVFQADTRTMNPTVPVSVVERAYREDAAGAAAEYGGLFRHDIAGFLQPEWVTAAVMDGRHELPPLPGVQYRAFCDPSGGASDAFTLGIAHNDDGRLVLDVCRAIRPPFDPEEVVKEFTLVLKKYDCHTVKGDRYSAEWVVSSFARHQVYYEVSERTKSEIYLEAQPLFATGAVQLLDIYQLQNELRQLERRTARAGKDSVDHPPRGHDDMANAACGALVDAVGSGPIDMSGAHVVSGEDARHSRDEHLAELGYASACESTTAPWDLH